MKMELFRALAHYENKLSELYDDVIVDELSEIKRHGAYNYVREERRINELNIFFLNLLDLFEDIINAYNYVELYEVIDDNTIINKIVKLNDEYNTKVLGTIRKYDIDDMTINQIEKLFNELYKELYNDKHFTDILDDTIKGINRRLDEED